ncbi:hypothetical protein [Allocoleopsis sp.]|uniref:hypothetical protein n=1 Tax=Allocoleopsis sp. TaxID=3088169 RepID=UPI002FCF9188
MTSPLARIESHPQEAKRLIGIDYEPFLALVALAEQRHLQKQAEIEKKKVRIIAPGGGRKPEMSPKETSQKTKKSRNSRSPKRRKQTIIIKKNRR